MTESAAATVHHELDRVRSFGIEIIGGKEAEELAKNGHYSHLFIGDLEPQIIRGIVEGFGVPFRFDVVGICAQDHGVPPRGQSHLDYRHQLFQAILDENPFPHALLYRTDEVPPTLNRLRSIATTAQELPTEEIYVMDSGMAAMTGALLDPTARSERTVIVLDIATSHTLGAAFSDRELASFFEYHTCDITLPRLEQLLQDLADGKLDHERILTEGGHGAYTRSKVGFNHIGAIVVTGPKRRLMIESKLPLTWGAPMGDNMMTGTAGLLEAIRARREMKPLALV
jgi:uncharacterized protein (DUF1786 family)